MKVSLSLPLHPFLIFLLMRLKTQEMTLDFPVTHAVLICKPYFFLFLKAIVWKKIIYLCYLYQPCDRSKSLSANWRTINFNINFHCTGLDSFG